ncbi:aminotransferase class V-fold PLP-dependent enzyme [Nocardioidaceae bacterium]|nr:aminotransferase class V-fold PLP-dependent enzyme [Nocardioidaceae bacterium]
MSTAADLDAADPLGAYAELFVRPDSVLAYLDGNSLGRPLKVTAERLGRFVEGPWGERLIRSWDEDWMQLPLTLGDRIGRVVLGAAAGQTVVADSTTVLLYKLLRAAVAARPGRDEIVCDTENFPTDRYLVEGVAAERGLTVRWIEPDPTTGVTVEEVAAVVSERTAVVLLSHVAYKSAFVADLAGITAAAHAAGALTLWDLSHSAGAIEVDLDATAVDLAVGCTYKYLNGGPGSPAFAYVAARHQEQLTQPISGWMGHAEPFAMGPAYAPADGMRRFVSGTPPILAMQPLGDMVDLIDRAGMASVAAKTRRLTDAAIACAEEHLAPLGVVVASPREAAVRGGHVLLEHPDMQRVVAHLWEQGVVPDFRHPRGLRAGLSPLSTTYAEVDLAVRAIGDLLRDAPAT